MDKRYQIFISSTYRDLIAERQAVLTAVLELEHIPAGMELFPASDDSSWALIKEVIDRSDYYVLIVGGRYGSVDNVGLSFTEREYDYAHQVGKPVIALLHRNPESLPRDHTDTKTELWERLCAFRKKIEQEHTCSLWDGSDDLRAKTIASIVHATRRFPAEGWVRAEGVASNDALATIERLRSELEDIKRGLPTDLVATKDLACGTDETSVVVSFNSQTEIKGLPLIKHEVHSNGPWFYYEYTVRTTWNEILVSVGSELYAGARQAVDVDMALARHLISKIPSEIATHISGRSTNKNDLRRIAIQLMALGHLSTRSIKRDSPSLMFVPVWEFTASGLGKYLSVAAEKR